MSIPMPAGTMIFVPSRQMSRCACTWYCNRSAVSGTSPALRASSIGLLGAGHGSTSPVDDEDFDDEHAAHTAHRATTTSNQWIARIRQRLEVRDDLRVAPLP